MKNKQYARVGKITPRVQHKETSKVSYTLDARAFPPKKYADTPMK